jgi:hypothetical protein
MRKVKGIDGGDTLSLKLSGESIAAERFVKGVSSFFGLITEVSDAVAGQRGAVQWTVSARPGSVIIEFKPQPVKVDAAVVTASVRAVREGVELIARKPERPRYWSDAALKRAKELADIVEPTESGLGSLRIDGGPQGAEITRKMGEHVNTLIGVELRALGSIEGRLRTVTEGGGLHFVVQDAVTHNKVRCYIKDEDTEKILAAFRRRVVVYGEIHYRRDRQPASINVERFRVLRDKNELPTADEVRGILA